MSEPGHPFDPEDDAVENDRLADARDLIARIDDNLQQGKAAQAKSLFARRWRDLVPELPLRFPIVLAKPSERAAAKLAQGMKGGQEPPALKLVPRSARHGGYVVSTSEGTRLGDLPAKDAEFLRSLGEDAALYTPHLLELRPPTKETDRPVLIAVELVRPELRYCSFCGKRHSDPHVNCADCRRERRQVNPDKAAEELPLVPLHEALDALISDEFDDQ